MLPGHPAFCRSVGDAMKTGNTVFAGIAVLGVMAASVATFSHLRGQDREVAGEWIPGGGCTTSLQDVMRDPSNMCTDVKCAPPSVDRVATDEESNSLTKKCCSVQRINLEKSICKFEVAAKDWKAALRNDPLPTPPNTRFDVGVGADNNRADAGAANRQGQHNDNNKAERDAGAGRVRSAVDAAARAAAAAEAQVENKH